MAARAIDGDVLWFSVVEAFDTEAKNRGQAGWAPGQVWANAPWRFSGPGALAAFLNAVERLLIAKHSALTGWNAPKSASAIGPLVSQNMQQSAYYMYGDALVFLSRDPNAKMV